MAACGPVAAIAFARRVGRNPTAQEALDLAKQVGWTTARGMAGPASEKALLDKMGVPSYLEQGVAWKKVQAEVESGNPVIIDTPGHYFVAEGFDPATGKFNFGNSGTALKAGKQWMSPDEMGAIGMGSPRAALYLDNPATPDRPSPTVADPVKANTRASMEGDLVAYARDTATKKGIDPDIYIRQLNVEQFGEPDNRGGRQWNPMAKSPAGAEGIGQLMPVQWQGKFDPKDPYANIDKSTDIMASHLKTYGGDYTMALAAYNAGPGNVAKYGGVPPFKETQSYINLIMGDGTRQPSSAPTPTSAPAPSQMPPQPPVIQNILDQAQAAYDRLGVSAAPLPPPPETQFANYQASRAAMVQRFMEATKPSTPPPSAAPPVPSPSPVPAGPTVEGVPLAALESYDQPTSVTGPPPGWVAPPPQEPAPPGPVWQNRAPDPSLGDRLGQAAGAVAGGVGDVLYRASDLNRLVLGNEAGNAANQRLAGQQGSIQHAVAGLRGLAAPENNLTLTDLVTGEHPQPGPGNPVLGAAASVLEQGQNPITLATAPFAPAITAAQVGAGAVGGEVGAAINPEGGREVGGLVGSLLPLGPSAVRGAGRVVQAARSPAEHLGQTIIDAIGNAFGRGGAEPAAADVARPAENISTVVAPATERAVAPGAGFVPPGEPLTQAERRANLARGVAGDTEAATSIRPEQPWEMTPADYASRMTDNAAAAAGDLNALQVGRRLGPWQKVGDNQWRQGKNYVDNGTVAAGMAKEPALVQQALAEQHAMMTGAPAMEVGGPFRSTAPEGAAATQQAGELGVPPGRPSQLFQAPQPVGSQAVAPLLSGAAGAGFGEQGTDENTSPQERLLRGGLGFMVGRAGGMTLAKTAAQVAREGFAGNIRLGKYVEPEVQALISRTVDSHPEIAEAARRGVIPDQVVQDLARMVGVKADEIVKRWKPGDAANAETLYALRQTLFDQAGAVSAAQKAFGAIPRGEDAGRELSALASEITRYRGVQEVVHGLTAEAGRALRQQRLMVDGFGPGVSEAAAQQRNLDLLLSQFKKGGGTLDDFTKFISTTDLSDPEAVARAARTLYHPSLGDWLKWYWYYNLLSSPAGRIRDTVSSAATTMMVPIEHAVAAPIHAVMRTGEGLAFKDVPGEFMQMAGAVGPGARAALRLLRSGFEPMEAALGGARSDIGRIATQEVMQGPLGGLPANLPSRIIRANDVFFKTINYTGSIYYQAKMIARGDAAEFAHLVANPTEEMVTRAVKEARYRSFQQDGSFVDAVSHIKRLSGGVGPVATFVVPFHQTPYNLAKYALERSPFGIAPIAADVARAAGAKLGVPGVTAATTTRAQQADRLARVAMGSALLLGFEQIGEHALTGPAPKDPDERDAFYRQGKQPYSILIGDQWHSYQGLQPFSTLLGGVAAIRDAVKRGQVDEGMAAHALLALATAQGIVDQPMLQGITNIARAIDDPARYSGNFVEQTARAAVPASGFWGAIARATDNIIRNPDGPVEAMQTVIPGLSEQIAPRIDRFGNVVERAPGQQGPQGVLDIMKPSTDKPDPVEIELARLQARGLRVEPSMVTSHFQVGPGDVTLTRDERSQYQIQAGRLAYATLTPIITSDSWKQVPELEKVKIIEAVYRQSRTVARARLTTPALFERGVENYRQQRDKLAS